MSAGRRRKAEGGHAPMQDAHPATRPLEQFAFALALVLLCAFAAAQPRAPEAPATEKVALEAEVLFDPGSRRLRAPARDALNDLVRRMRGLDWQAIRAVGHADRTGSEAANHILAEERAAAVKAYLVNQGIAHERVHASARGDLEPNTRAGACSTSVACLQADRRVLVEVSGTRVAQAR